MIKNVPVEYTPDGEAFISLDDDMIAALGTKPGDSVEWTDNGDGSWTLKRKDTQYVLVETISMFRMRYLVEVPNGHADYALDTVVCKEAENEFSQKHLDEVISSHRVISAMDAVELFREDNNNHVWTDEEILNRVITKVK